MSAQDEISVLQDQLKKAKKSISRGRIGLVVLGILVVMNFIYGFINSLEVATQRELVLEATAKAVMFGEETRKARNQAIDAAEEMARTLEECASLKKAQFK